MSIGKHGPRCPVQVVLCDLCFATYVGTAPFTGTPLTLIPATFPWKGWTTPEKWAANVDDTGFGVGVYNGEAERFIGGFAGTPLGETKDGCTGYIAPLHTMTLTKDTVYEWAFDLIVGQLEDIRAFAYAAQGRPAVTNTDPKGK